MKYVSVKKMILFSSIFTVVYFIFFFAIIATVYTQGFKEKYMDNLKYALYVSIASALINWIGAAFMYYWSKRAAFKEEQFKKEKLEKTI